MVGFLSCNADYSGSVEPLKGRVGRLGRQVTDLWVWGLDAFESVFLLNAFSGMF